ncbi:filamentous hemagglutinin family N-terminal domain [Xenococcus sp. PCC 7305]|uniref:two-partner secretion domain-containing protein n=1 Tax=Xenococcus sp. PCC 7305 TaxID=102125 RepID=UPI0002AB9F75|nr:filamentous hemagglutinin N-terminal domain-containing protein [Xenococcus sp. PCC 7305]ELS02214.1 filamentous hemagglutinin family N-terminal domain [Xenococcus sp. PCC 7305]
MFVNSKPQNIIFTAGLLCLFAPSLSAQIVPDGTTNSTVEINGNELTIQQGDRAGDNLFHSFQDFSVPTDGSAFFNNSVDIVNIFSRVTGGNISNIDGILGANGTANLFLINPAGIIFGEGASLDIGGSFFGSTADSIIFSDGEFSATDLDNPPLLTINAPIGFNFRDNPGDIANRSVAQNRGSNIIGLEVTAGNNLTLVGGNIDFEGGEATARSGLIELGSLSSAGTVGINADGSLSFPENVSLADINLRGTDLDVRGTGSGKIIMNARNLNLEASDIQSSQVRAGVIVNSTPAEAPVGDIRINATENITVDNSIVLNRVNSVAVTDAGNISITTNSLNLNNGGRIDASTAGQGNAGSIAITAGDTITIDGENSQGSTSGVTNLVNSGATGDTGGITITTGSLSLSRGGRVSASTFGEGDAGSVAITASDAITIDGENSRGNPSGITNSVNSSAVGDSRGIAISTDSLSLTDGGRVEASTFGEGNAGSVAITAGETINIDGENSQGNPSGVNSFVNREAVGNSGGIVISTGSLSLTDGGRVSANTFGEGDAGSLAITARDRITIDGENSGGTPSGANSLVNQGAEGNSGGIVVSTGSLSLNDGGRVEASTFGRGNAGSVEITASDAITINGTNSRNVPSGVTSQVNPDAVGEARGVTITTGSLSLTNGGRVSASTFGRGNAGSVEITAANDILIDGKDLDDRLPSRATSLVNQGAVGNAGGVTITAGSLTLTDGGLVSTATLGQGDAGDVTVNVRESIIISGLSELARAGLSANAVIRNGNGGNVNVVADEITIDNGGTIEASNFDSLGIVSPGTGEPGNINITANSLSLNNEARIDTATQSETGNSANISLQIAENITLDNNSFISARAFSKADGGNININAKFIIAFPNGNNDIIASAQQGRGGNIDITATALFGIQERLQNPLTNDMDASSEFGLDGNVSIVTPDSNNIQTEIQLPNNPIATEQTVAQACSNTTIANTISGLTIKGKGGIPPKPNQPFDSDTIIVDTTIPDSNAQAQTAALSNSEDSTKVTHQYPNIQPIKTSMGDIYPARGIIKTVDGQVILTAYKNSDINIRTPHASANCASP